MKQKITGIVALVIMILMIAEFIYELCHGRVTIKLIGLIALSAVMGWLYLSEKK